MKTRVGACATPPRGLKSAARYARTVGEVPAAPIAESLKLAASASGFSPKLSVVEITGTCAHCQQAA